MTTILFWNTNNKQVEAQLGSLIKTYDTDIVILAECSMDDAAILSKANQDRPQVLYRVSTNSERLQFFTSLPLDCVTAVADFHHYTFCRVAPPVGLHFTLAAVHFPSLRNHEIGDLNHLAIRFARDMEIIESQMNDTRTVVVGDLNMDPFSDGLVSGEGLHAVMDRRLAEKRTRIVDGRQRRFLYNPMWNRLGDATEGPPGTYYYPRSSSLVVFWHTFDQVLLRPELLPEFDDTKLHIPISVGTHSLATRSGTPSNKLGSDHFPVIFSLSDNHQKEEDEHGNQPLG